MSVCVIIILVLAGTMVTISLLITLHYKRKIKELMDSHRPAPVYEDVGPLQTQKQIKLKENVCYAQNITPKDNVTYYEKIEV